ncbi:hypothetical protein GCM10022221_09600 [Actinocorallia aurea]
MTDPLEQALTRTLATKAGDAPQPVPGLADRAARRSRKRRRTRLGAAAAVAVLLAGGVGWGVLNPNRVDEIRPAVQPSDGASAEPVPVERLWPKAVHRVKAVPPEGVEDGWDLISVIDMDRLLISWSGPGEPTRYAAYTPETGKVGTLPPLSWGPALPEISRGHVLWHRFVMSGSSELTIASLPDGSGSDPSRRITILNSDGSGASGHRAGFTEDGKRLYWETSEGVFTRAWSPDSPVKTPGEPEKAAPAGNRIVEWPWVARLNDPSSPAVFATIRNVETGETRTAVLPEGGGTGWICGVVWCLGKDEIRKRDGSVTVPNPAYLAPGPPKDAVGATTPATITSPTPTSASDTPGGPTFNRYSGESAEPVLDRFLFQGTSTSQVLVKDLVSGRTGSFAATTADVLHGREDGRFSRYVVERTDDGYLFVDFAAIE